jgi:pentatricopeptide repeat protein
MSENALYDLSYYGKDNNWEKALDIYFEWLNKR